MEENSGLLLQKGIVYPEIVHQEDNKLPKVLRVFCNACMNIKNYKNNLFNKKL